ncbi:MAG: expansin EXLX1 family cellulose-binding protein [Chloroflexota bacterium]
MSGRNAKKILSASIILLLVFFGALSSAKGQSGYSVWLPLAGKSKSNPLHNGIATFYNEANGQGTCSFSASPNDLQVTAMNAAEFDNAAYCGAYLYVTGPAGSTTVRVVDLCPGCGAGHLDLSRQAFAKLVPAGADIDAIGRIDITWRVVSPALDGPIAYHFKDGSNPWWTAVQIRNHRNPIARFEYRNGSGQWVDVPRVYYNFFVQTTPGMGEGPFTFRVTDWYGNTLTDSNIPLLNNGTINGSGQFPPGP